MLGDTLIECKAKFGKLQILHPRFEYGHQSSQLQTNHWILKASTQHPNAIIISSVVNPQLALAVRQSGNISRFQSASSLFLIAFHRRFGLGSSINYHKSIQIIQYSLVNVMVLVILKIFCAISFSLFPCSRFSK